MSPVGLAALVAVLVVALGGLSQPLVLGTAPAGRRAGGRWASGLRRARGLVARPGHGDELGEVERLRTALVSGASLLSAFDAVARAGGPWAQPAGSIARRARAGVPLQVALDEWGAAGEGPALVADALAIAGATGGSQSAALDAVAATVRDRRSLRREIRALSSQAMASAAVLVAAPIAFAVLVAALDARVRAIYVGSLAGPACAVGGLLLDAAGACWMAALVRRVR